MSGAHLGPCPGSPASPTASPQGPRRRCSASLPPTQAQRLSTKSSGPQSRHAQPSRGTSVKLWGSCQGQRARLQERPAPGGEQPCTPSPTWGVLLGRLPLKMGARPGPGPQAPLSPAAVRQTLSSAQTRQMDWPGGWSPRHIAPSQRQAPGQPAHFPARDWRVRSTHPLPGHHHCWMSRESLNPGSQAPPSWPESAGQLPNFPARRPYQKMHPTP